MTNLRSTSLCLPVFLFCVLNSFIAQAETAPSNDARITRNTVFAATGQSIPAEAFGVLIIERPREVTLLHLRGMQGTGKAILRGDEPGICLIFPVRFVAGDFGGESISGHVADPIQLIIKSRRVASALANGKEVVSDSYRVSGHKHPEAEIVLQSGLVETFGFVINPGRNILSDIFGVTTKSINCQPM